MPPMTNSTPTTACTHFHPDDHADLDELGDAGEQEPEADEVADRDGGPVVGLEDEQPDEDPQDPGDEQHPPPLPDGWLTRVRDAYSSHVDLP